MANKTDSSANKRIGRMLQYARERKHKTQQDIAAAGNMSKNHISAIERGVAKASIDLLLIYCEVLEMTPNEILQVDGDMPNAVNPELVEIIAGMDSDRQAKFLDFIRTF